MANLVRCDCCTRQDNIDFKKGIGYNSLTLDDQTKEGKYSISIIMCDSCTREMSKNIQKTKDLLYKKHKT